ncbi:hypothetical protein [Streptomyces sp. AA0539]|uniref:hypothetical protein n=1 Tax=Streptomyces sp. AA0539 TaxID=1210045 RepID=UPI0002E2D4E7|nr:hypothetical protein [Streptomyces sp. AA0539]
MRITLARTPRTYLAAALASPADDGRPTAVPALDRTGTHRWPRRIAARLGLPQATAPPGAATVADARAVLAGTARPGHLVIALAGEDDPFAFPAAVFALAKRATLVLARDPDAVLTAAGKSPDAHHLTLVGPTDRLGFALTTELRHRHPGPALGVLCADTPDRLADLVLKTLAHPAAPAGRDALLAPLLKGAEPLTQGRLTIYPQDALDPAAFAAPAGATAPGTAERPLLRVLSLITHGSEDYLRLTPRDILCGLTPDPAEQAAARATTHTLPACMRGDDCVYPEARRLDPATVPAQIVFVNACLTLKFGTQLFGRHNRFTVARRFLDGWAGTYIASPLLKDGTPAENLLFHHLLDEGLTVGEAVREVNTALRAWGIDAPEILVIGDPEARYTDPSAPAPAPAPAGTVTVTERAGGARITFHHTMPARTRVPLRDPALREAHRAGRLRVTADTPFGGRHPVYATSAVLDGTPHVVVLGFQDRPLTGTRTSRTLTVTDGTPSTPADRIVRAVERYENLASLDIRLDKTRSVLADAANSLPAVARRVRAGIGDLTQSEPLAKATGRILGNCARLDRHLLATLLRLTETREYHFVEAYRPAYAVRAVDSPYGRCRYCGEPQHRYHSAHVLRPWLTRQLLSCPLCGATQDTEDDSVRLTLTGETRLDPERPAELTAVIDNDGEEPLDVLLGARITRGRAYGFGFRLDPDTLRVDPGATGRARLTITSGTPPVRHAMLLRLYAVGMGRIDFAGRELWFR